MYWYDGRGITNWFFSCNLRWVSESHFDIDDRSTKYWEEFMTFQLSIFIFPSNHKSRKLRAQQASKAYLLRKPTRFCQKAETIQTNNATI